MGFHKNIDVYKNTVAIYLLNKKKYQTQKKADEEPPPALGALSLLRLSPSVHHDTELRVTQLVVLEVRE